MVVRVDEELRGVRAVDGMLMRREYEHSMRVLYLFVQPVMTAQEVQYLSTRYGEGSKHSKVSIAVELG